MAKVYIFRDPVGRIGQLQLEPEQISRLREHLQRDQREDVFEVRRGQYLGPAIGGKTETIVLMDLDNGRKAQLTLVTFKQFAADVTNNRPGTYQVKSIDP